MQRRRTCLVMYFQLPAAAWRWYSTMRKHLRCVLNKRWTYFQTCLCSWLLFGGACSLEGSSGLVLVLEEDSPSLKAGVEPGPSSCDDLHYLTIWKRSHYLIKKKRSSFDFADGHLWTAQRAWKFKPGNYWRRCLKLPTFEVANGPHLLLGPRFPAALREELSNWAQTVESYVYQRIYSHF